MTNTTSTGRHDAILGYLADLDSHSTYVADLLSQIDPGDAASVKIANIGTLTVYDTFATSQSAAAPSISELVLDINKEKFSLALIDRAAEEQNVGGDFLGKVTRQALIQLRNAVDQDVLANMAVFASGSTDTYNAAADT